MRQNSWPIARPMASFLCWFGHSFEERVNIRGVLELGIHLDSICLSASLYESEAARSCLFGSVSFYKNHPSDNRYLMGLFLGCFRGPMGETVVPDV